MKLEPSKQVVFEWEGEEYKLRKLKVKEAREQAKEMRKIDAQKEPHLYIDLTIKYLEKCGLPTAVAEDMEMSHLQAIGGLLTGVNSTGK